MSRAASRFHGEEHDALNPEDDWFAGDSEARVEADAPAWHDDTAVYADELPPDDLGRRQVAVVGAVIVAVALVAAVILGVRALTGSDDRTTTPTTTIPTTTTPSPAATTPATTPTTTQPEPSTTPSTTPSSTAAAVPTGTVLRPGDNGASIEALQTALASLGHDPGEVDGIYGAVTKEAVTAFQNSKGLEEDGIAGPNTIAAINSALAAG